MAGALHKIIGVLRLVRVELALSAVSNIWLMVALGRHVEMASRQTDAISQMPLWELLLLTGAVAGGLHVYGAALNDVLDRRHDRIFQPHRPIPAGGILPGTAAIIGFISLLIGMFAAVFLGQNSVLLCLAAAVGILFYDALGKFIPGVGLVTLALMRAVNMFIPNPLLGFAWPIWASMTHIMGCLAIVYWLEGKRPRMDAKDWVILGGGWAFWTLAILGWMNWRNTRTLHADSGVWLLPAAAGVMFAFVSWRWLSPRLESISSRRAAGTGYLRLSMQWLILYDMVWLLAAGLYRPASLHAGLLVLSLLLSKLIDDWGEGLSMGDAAYRVAHASPEPKNPGRS